MRATRRSSVFTSGRRGPTFSSRGASSAKRPSLGIPDVSHRAVLNWTRPMRHLRRLALRRSAGVLTAVVGRCGGASAAGPSGSAAAARRPKASRAPAAICAKPWGELDMHPARDPALTQHVNDRER